MPSNTYQNGFPQTTPSKDDGKSAKFPVIFAAQELEKLDPERIPCDSDQPNWGGYKPNHALHQMGKTVYTWARGEAGYAGLKMGWPSYTRETRFYSVLGTNFQNGK